jgi:hypothetical protein
MQTVARDEAFQEAILFKWPASEVPSPARLVCGVSEVAVVVRHGAVLGALGPGSHSLDASAVPFLSLATDSGSQSLQCEIYFVTTSQIPLRLGGATQLRDPSTGIVAQVRIAGDALARVAEPGRLAVAALPITAEPDSALQWIRGMVLNQLIDTVGAMTQSKSSVLDVIGAPEAVAAEVESALGSSLGPLGIEVSVPSVFLSVDEETAARMRPVSSQTQQAAGSFQPLVSGTRVMVQWTDGNWHPASVGGYQEGWYAVVWSNGASAWVPTHVVRPA